MQDYFETLRRIALDMGPQRVFQAKARSVLGMLAERHGFLRPHLMIFDPQTRMLHLCMAESVPRNGQVVYEPGVGVTGQVFATGRPVIVERLLGHPVFMNKFFARTSEEMANLAFVSVPVPVCSGSGEDIQVIGVLGADTPCAPREELEIKCRFLEAVAAMLSTQVAYMQDDLARQQRLSAASEAEGEHLVAVSKTMRLAMEQAVYAGRNRGSVLISGESGTGKERLAAVVHAASPRGDLPMVRFRGAGLSDESARRELFGYRKGAFPGATQTHKGLFELAGSSTLFLDDVETLSLPLQRQIFQALQDQEISRVGGGEPVPIDVRLICSTTQSLEQRVSSGDFLEELRSRISAFSIQLAPLRERREDILPLARYFMKIAAENAGRCVERISAPAQELLARYSWPGNIHELRRCMEQAVSVCEDKILRAGHLPSALRIADEDEQRPSLSFNDAVARFEQELLTDALQRTQGNMLQAARELQASYRIVNYKVKKYGIDPRKFSLLKS